MINGKFTSVVENMHKFRSWGSICLSPKIGTDVRTPKSKNEFVEGQYLLTPSPILSPTPKKTILGQEVLKTHEILCHLISALNVRESPKFPRLKGNLRRGTRW